MRTSWVLSGWLALVLCLITPPSFAATASKPAFISSVGVYLNPHTGRFWSMDSFEGNSSDPATLHKYLYCHADSINGWDPSGHEFSFVGISAATAIGSYLTTTLVQYTVGKAVSATWLKLSDGNLDRFQWFEASDSLVFVPGSVLFTAGKLPVEMVMKVGGKVVGKAFAAGGADRVTASFALWFASSGGKLVMRSADGSTIVLEQGWHNAVDGSGKGFTHLIQRHLPAFWDGSKLAKTTLWPANVAPNELLNLLKEAAKKYAVNGKIDQDILLSNGITARLVVANGEVISFYPVKGGISASQLAAAVP